MKSEHRKRISRKNSKFKALVYSAILTHGTQYNSFRATLLTISLRNTDMLVRLLGSIRLRYKDVHSASSLK